MIKKRDRGIPIWKYYREIEYCFVEYIFNRELYNKFWLKNNLKMFYLFWYLILRNLFLCLMYHARFNVSQNMCTVSDKIRHLFDIYINLDYWSPVKSILWLLLATCLRIYRVILLKGTNKHFADFYYIITSGKIISDNYFTYFSIDNIVSNY